jgi:predicted Zn-dependent protease
LPRALADIRQALEMDSEHFQARLELALILTQENPTEAAAQLQILQGRDPSNHKVSLALAIVRRRLGQLEEAREILDRILASNRDDVAALLERGRIDLDMQKLDDAERWLRRALALAPDEPGVNLALSSCLERAGRAAEAKPFHERFLRLEAERQRRTDDFARQLKSGGVQ